MYPQFPGMSMCSHGVCQLAGCRGLVRKRLGPPSSSRLFVRRPSGAFISNLREKIPLGLWVDNVRAMSVIWRFLLPISSFGPPSGNAPFCSNLVSPPPPLPPQPIIFLIHRLAITAASLVLPLQMWRLISSGKYQPEQRGPDPVPPPPSPSNLAPLALPGREQIPPKPPPPPELTPPLRLSSRGLGAGRAFGRQEWRSASLS